MSTTSITSYEEAVAQHEWRVPERYNIAQDLAANAPLSVRGNKRVIRELLAAEGRLDPEMQNELIELREASFHSEDMREGVRAFGEKRPARWKGR